MHYTTLGRTGMRVSIAGLGCGGFSRLGLGTGGDEAGAIAIIRQAIELGVNLFDTAASYGTEAVLGKAIKSAPRDSVVICTKAPFSWSSGRADPEGVVAALDNSLRQLDAEYIDVYQLHGVSPANYAHALEELAPAVTADPGLAGRVVEHVPHSLAAAAGAAPGQPPDHFFLVHHQLEHHRQLGVQLGQHLLQRLGLGHVAREAVEQKPGLRVVLGQPVADHRHGDLVGDEITAVHVLLGLGAEVGAVRNVEPEDVACGNARDRQVRCHEVGLSPFARSGGPNQDDAHYRRKPS